MTIRERIMAVYKHQLPDQIPVSIYARYLPRGSTERTVRDLGLGILDNIPLTTLLAPPWHTHTGFISEVQGADFDIRFTWENGQKYETRFYHTPLGTLTQRLRQDPTYGSDWIEKFYLNSREDYKILQYIVEHTILRRNEGTFLAKQEDMGEDGIVLGRVDRCPFQKLLIELAGPERFLVDLYTDPGPALELLAGMEKRMDEVFEVVCESAAGVIWQPDNVSCDLTPPKCFKEYCLPYYQKQGKKVRERGKVYVVHMDGRLRAIKELIALAPIDVIESFSFPEIGGDLSFVEATSAWPGKVIAPNFPSSLATQDEGAILAFLDKLLSEVGPGRPFMLQISEDIPPGSWQHALPIVCRRMQRQ
jgi:hypothetical protein